MDSNESTVKSWKSSQVYGLAVICLLAGIGIGYLARAPQEDAARSQVANPAAAHAPGAAPTPEQLKQMADKQAEPLLAKLSASPDDPALLAEIAKVYYQARQYPVASKYYEDSLRVKPDTAVFVKLGGAYHFDGNDGKAIEAWNQALRLDSGNPDALYNIGLVSWQSQGNRKAAISAWQKLLETNPNHPKRAQVEEYLAQVKQHPDIPVAGDK